MATPVARNRVKNFEEDTPQEVTLTSEENVAACRALAVRTFLLSQDRPELQYAVKEVTKFIQQPSEECPIELDTAAKECTTPARA